MPMDRPIKIGLLLDSFSIPAWAYEMLQLINESGKAEIALAVVNNSPSKSAGKKIANNLNKILYFGYSLLDRKIFKCQPDAFAKRNLYELLPDLETLSVAPIQKKFSDRFPNESIAEIKKHDIDIFIRLGFRILRGEILSTARYGVWSYHHGDNKVNRGGPAGFWETMESHPATGTVLQILTENLDAGKVLCRSWSLTEYYSVNKNRNKIYWKSLAFIPRKISELYDLGAEEFFRKYRSQEDKIDNYDRRLYTFPGNWKMFKLIAVKMFDIFCKSIRKIFIYRQWIMLFSFKKGPSHSFFRFKMIIPPKDRYWADPFPVKHGDNYYIFFEEVIRKTNRGHISVMEINKKGNMTEPSAVLKRPYHLSYPFIFEHDNEYYMIPESAQNRTIDLYRCASFPDKWEPVKTLIDDVYAVDSTVFYHNGKWRLFCNIIEHDGASSLDELHIFHTDDLLNGTWATHKNNPVISDVRSSRPAGRIFKLGEKIVRPSQNCSHRYGYGLKFNEIIELSDNEFKEIEIDSVEPKWDKKIIGLHTCNSESGLTVIDGYMNRSRFI